jgi:hypothetical protein
MLTRLVLFFAISLGSTVFVAIRPWRFWRALRSCHQCKTPLTNRGVWGWDEEVACPTCGCRFIQ